MKTGDNMTKRINLADSIPYGFPFVAELSSLPFDYKKTVDLVTVLGYSGMERHYLRVKLPCGKVTVANDSMLDVLVAE